MKNKIIFLMILVLSMFIVFTACDQKSEPLTEAKIQAAYDKCATNLTDKEVEEKQGEIGKCLLAELKIKDQLEWTKALRDSKLIDKSADLESIVFKTNLIVYGTYISLEMTFGDFTNIEDDVEDVVDDVEDVVEDIVDDVKDVVTPQITGEIIQATYDAATLGKTEEEIVNGQVEIANLILEALGIDETQWLEVTADMPDAVVETISSMLNGDYVTPEPQGE